VSVERKRISCQCQLSVSVTAERHYARFADTFPSELTESENDNDLKKNAEG
jgi:hypothetical protein